MKKQNTDIIEQSHWKLPKKEFDALISQIALPKKIENIIIFFDAQRLSMGVHPKYKLDEALIAINDSYNYLKDMEWHLTNALGFI